MPTIGSEFNEMSIVSWVATAYILTFDAFRKLNKSTALLRKYENFKLTD